MPTIEEITSRMPNAQVFSVLDASSGYWQVSLDEESSHLQYSIWEISIQKTAVWNFFCRQYLSSNNDRNVRGFTRSGSHGR